MIKTEHRSHGEFCYHLDNGGECSDLKDMGVLFPVVNVGSGLSATCYKDSKGNILRITKNYLDCYLDKRMQKNGFPVLESNLFLCSKSGGKAFGVTYRENIECLTSIKVKIKIDEELNDYLCHRTNDMLINKVIADKISHIYVEDIANYLIDNIEPVYLINFLCDLKKMFRENKNINSLISVHKKYFSDFVKLIDFNDRNYGRGRIESDKFLGGSSYKIYHHFSGFIALSSIIGIPESEKRFLDILDGILDFYEKTKMFPYDCKSENLGFYKNNVMVRDYYFVTNVYQDLYFNLVSDFRKDLNENTKSKTFTFKK